MKRINILLSFLFFLAVASKGQTPANGSVVYFNLKQVLDYAMQNNLTIKNSALDEEIARKKIWEITATGLPQVSAAGNYQHVFQVPQLSFGGQPVLSVDNTITPGTVITSDMIRNKSITIGNEPSAPIKLSLPNYTYFTFSLSQLIFSGAYFVGLQATKTYALISAHSLDKVKLDTKETVTGTYYLALSLTESRNILKENLISIRKTQADMKEMNKQGFTEDTDVDQIGLTTTNMESALSSLDRQIDNVLSLLKMQINMPLDTKLELTDKLDQVISQVNLETIFGQRPDLSKNIDYKIVATSVDLAKLNMKKDQADYLPTIAGYYQHLEKLKKPAFDMQPKDVAGISLNLPIFSSGQKRAVYQQHKLELEKMVNNKKQVEQGINLSFTSAQNDLKSANDKYRNEKMNIELAKKIYDKTLIKYKEGVSTSMDLTNSYNQYLTAQSNYFIAIYSVLQAKTKLDKLTDNL